MKLVGLIFFLCIPSCSPHQEQQWSNHVNEMKKSLVWLNTTASSGSQNTSAVPFGWSNLWKSARAPTTTTTTTPTPQRWRWWWSSRVPPQQQQEPHHPNEIKRTSKWWWPFGWNVAKKDREVPQKPTPPIVATPFPTTTTTSSSTPPPLSSSSAVVTRTASSSSTLSRPSRSKSSGGRGEEDKRKKESSSQYWLPSLEGLHCEPVPLFRQCILECFTADSPVNTTEGYAFSVSTSGRYVRCVQDCKRDFLETPIPGCLGKDGEIVSGNIFAPEGPSSQHPSFYAFKKWIRRTSRNPYVRFCFKLLLSVLVAAAFAGLVFYFQLHHQIRPTVASLQTFLTHWISSLQGRQRGGLDDERTALTSTPDESSNPSAPFVSQNLNHLLLRAGEFAGFVASCRWMGDSVAQYIPWSDAASRVYQEGQQRLSSSSRQAQENVEMPAVRRNGSNNTTTFSRRELSSYRDT